MAARCLVPAECGRASSIDGAGTTSCYISSPEAQLALPVLARGLDPMEQGKGDAQVIHRQVVDSPCKMPDNPLGLRVPRCRAGGSMISVPSLRRRDGGFAIEGNERKLLHQP